MLWVKAFHIIFVTSFFAGIFYLPRILVNLATVNPSSMAEKDRLLLMGKKLLKFTNLLMFIALLLGLWLWLGFGIGRGTGNGWLHVKLLLTLGVVGFHVTNARLLRRFELSLPTPSHVTLRWYNEISVILFAFIVILVVVKPF